MANPLFQLFGNQQQQGPFNNPMQLMQEFNKFKSTFQGDPKQKVQEMLNSGQMSQEQFNQLSTMAQIFQGLMRR